MKSWQAWVVTLSVSVVAVLQLVNFIELRLAARELDAELKRLQRVEREELKHFATPPAGVSSEYR